MSDPQAIDSAESFVHSIPVVLPPGQASIKVEVPRGALVEDVGFSRTGEEGHELFLIVRSPEKDITATVAHMLHVATQDMSIPAVPKGNVRRRLSSVAHGPVVFVSYLDEPG